MKLQLYVLRQLAVALAFAVGGILVVAMPGIAVSAVHRLPGADAILVLRYVPIVLQTIAPYVLPICFLLALVATFGRLAADREWTAIQMAGVRPAKMLLPPLALALALGAGTQWMVSTQLPHLKTRSRQLEIQASTAVLENLRPGRTSLKIGEFVLEALWQDPDTRLLHEVYIRKPASGDEERLDYHAETAQLRVVDGVLLATLTDLHVVRPGEETGQTYHEWFEFEFPLLDHVQGRRKSSPRPRYKTSQEITDLLARGEIDPRLVPSYRFELHYRWVLSCAYLLFVFLGVPTGLILRHGTQLAALAASSGYGLLYYLLNMRLAKDVGISGAVHPALGAWLPTALGLLVALPLLRRALAR